MYRDPEVKKRRVEKADYYLNTVLVGLAMGEFYIEDLNQYQIVELKKLLLEGENKKCL